MQTLHVILKGQPNKNSTPQDYQGRAAVCGSLLGTNILPVNTPLIVHATRNANISSSTLLR